MGVKPKNNNVRTSFYSWLARIYDFLTFERSKNSAEFEVFKKIRFRRNSKPDGERKINNKKGSNPIFDNSEAEK